MNKQTRGRYCTCIKSQWSFLFIPAGTAGLLIFLTGFSFPQQNKTDSLYQLLRAVQYDSQKVDIHNALAFELAYTNPDSAKQYAFKSLDLSEKHLKSATDEDNPKFLSSKAASFHNLGVIEYYAGNFQSALEYYSKAVAIRTALVKEYPFNLNLKNDLADSYNNIGIVYKKQGKYDKALEYYHRVLNIYEAIDKLSRGDFSAQSGLGAAYNNLGLIYQTTGKYSEALQYHMKSLKIKEAIGDRSGIAFSYNNIGIVYYTQGNIDLALEYYNKSVNIRSQIGDKKGMAVSYNNIGNIYSDKGEYKEALEYFMKSLNIKEELGDNKGMAASYSNIASLYYEYGGQQKDGASAEKYYKNALYYYMRVLKMDEENSDPGGIASSSVNIGSVCTKLGRYREAMEYLQRGLDLSKKSGEKDIIKDAYLGLSELHEKTGNYKMAYEFQRFYWRMKDTILNEESSRQIAEMEARYQSEKKESQIKLLEKDKEKKELESKRQRLFLLLIAAIALALAVIAVVVFRSLRITRKQKLVIEEQKALVDEKNKHIERKQKEIIDSITYAKRLQEAILPPIELIKRHLPDSFILYKPKDIVAGDFHWMDAMDNIVFIAAADCTGHGVPGAMVSVVCSNALNRSVKEFGLRDTGKILDKVTDLVLETFEKSGEQIKDGMDISLLKIEFAGPSWTHPAGISWSGANNPLWYMQNGRFNEIAADKQPVGKHDKRKSFTTHCIEQGGNPVFYLFTDGFADQFGGPKEKKFMYRRFENLLSEIYKLPMDEQQAILEKAFNDWKGALEQVDDVTVIGIKI